MTRLEDALAEAARARRLLVATDYDGTLSEIVEDPAAAVPVAGTVEALDDLAEMKDTVVAIVSGRTREELTALFTNPALVLIGEHGAARGDDPDPDVAAAVARARGLVEEIAERTPGSRVETKPRSVAFHYRTVEDGLAEEAVRRLRVAAARLEGIRMLTGKKVLELRAATDSKAGAVADLRRENDIDVVVFLGDDVTDETIFEALEPPDVTVKVGTGPTAADHRVPDPEAVVRVLRRLGGGRSPQGA